MANTVYKSGKVSLIDGQVIYITPLKIKYLRDFMEEFSSISKAEDDMDAIYRLAKCVAITMQQYFPMLKTAEDVEDVMDLQTMYKILELSADIKIADQGSEVIKEVSKSSSESQSWDSFDLAKLESELFLLGIWKDYEDLESSLSMPELMATLSAKRELDYSEKKFFAAIQGVDLEAAQNNKEKEEDPWQKIQARAAARVNGQDPDTAEIKDPNDIVSFVGQKAQQAGFGIGMGLEYSTTI